VILSLSANSGTYWHLPARDTLVGRCRNPGLLEELSIAVAAGTAVSEWARASNVLISTDRHRSALPIFRAKVEAHCKLLTNRVVELIAQGADRAILPGSRPVRRAGAQPPVSAELVYPKEVYAASCPSQYRLPLYLWWLILLFFLCLPLSLPFLELSDSLEVGLLRDLEPCRIKTEPDRGPWAPRATGHLQAPDLPRGRPGGPPGVAVGPTAAAVTCNGKEEERPAIIQIRPANDCAGLYSYHRARRPLPLAA
jgi:hypothetical protein